VGGVITDTQATGKIKDDDAPPLVTIADTSGNEGNRGTATLSFTVSLSAASGKWVYVYYATADDTATTADNDYVAKSSYVAFAPGQTTATITVQIRGDKKKEDNESFVVNLLSATDATLTSDTQAVGTILNNDKGNGRANNNTLAAALFADDTLTETRKRR
jgi:hypothetical protein